MALEAIPSMNELPSLTLSPEHQAGLSHDNTSHFSGIHTLSGADNRNPPGIEYGASPPLRASASSASSPSVLDSVSGNESHADGKTESLDTLVKKALGTVRGIGLRMVAGKPPWLDAYPWYVVGTE